MLLIVISNYFLLFSYTKIRAFYWGFFFFFLIGQTDFKITFSFSLYYERTTKSKVFSLYPPNFLCQFPNYSIVFICLRNVGFFCGIYWNTFRFLLYFILFYFSFFQKQYHSFIIIFLFENSLQIFSMTNFNSCTFN